MRDLGRFLITAAAALALFVGTGCTPPPDTGKMKVALLMPGKPDDGGWSQLAHQAVKALEAELGAQVTSTVSRGSFPDDVRECGSQGVDLVIAHGGEYAKDLVVLAAQFPKSKFLNSGGDLAGPANMRAVVYRLQEASYLAGVVAGSMTKSKKVGAIGGQEFPTVSPSLQAFINGARSVDPAIEGTIVYADTWDSTPKAKEQTLALLSKGVDVVFQNCDAAGQGVFEACQEKGAWSFGSNGDQNADPRFSKLILGSAVIDIAKTFRDNALDVKAGKFGGGVVYAAGLSGGYLRYTPNPAHAAQVPEGLPAKLEAIQALIAKGELDVLKAP